MMTSFSAHFGIRMLETPHPILSLGGGYLVNGVSGSLTVFPAVSIGRSQLPGIGR